MVIDAARPAREMDIRLLGPLEVRAGNGSEGPLPLGGPRQRALFGLLALRTPRVVSRPALIDGIWGDAPPPAATKTLHAHVAYLRRNLTAAGLDGPILTRPPGYALAASPHQVDARRFEDLVERGRAALLDGSPADAARMLGDALRLWRGEALADCPLGEWARAEVAALHETRLYATEDLLAARLALGDHARAAAELENLVAAEPLRERLWELLMVALYRCGRQGDALSTYRRARSVLVEELGVEPGSGLRTLQDAILSGDDRVQAVTGVPAARPAAAAADRPGGEGALPAPLTRLVGRRAEIAELGRLLPDHRLVTLTGVGGCGKTRLAIALASQVADRYAAGVRFVDLSAVTAGRSVPDAVAGAFGLRERPGADPLDELVRHARLLRLLLVLDNCEHLAGSCADVVTTLLTACPAVTVLATSREPLGVPGEMAWPVPALSVPGDGGGGLATLRRHESVQLFLDRAAVPAVRSLTDADGPALAAICTGLDGLPLAIELAAARTAVLTIPEIAQRLRDPALLGSAGGRRRPHHATLEATMAWSYRLLDPVLRSRFRRLAVFTGGFTGAAAQALWAATPEQALDSLHDLVDKSLVVVHRRGGAARYRLLETIRHYAAGQLAAAPDEQDAARRAHAVHYRRLAEDAGRELRGPGLREGLDRLSDDEENLLAALRWYAGHGPGADELHLASALVRYFHLRGRYALGRRCLEEALSRAAGADAADLARARLRAANLALFECDYAAAARHGEQALAEYRRLADLGGTAGSLKLLASVDRERGDYPVAAARGRDAVHAYRAAGDDAGVADALQMAGFTAWLRGDLAAADELVTDALRRFQVLGDTEGIASARIHLAAVAHYNGERARARWLAEDALARCTRLGFKEGIAWARNVLGLVEQRDGQRDRAVATLNASLRIHAELGDRWRSASVLEALAGVLAGDAPRTAVELLATATAIREWIGAPVPPQERPARDAALITVHNALSEPEIYAARARGETSALGDLAARLPG